MIKKFLAFLAIFLLSFSVSFAAENSVVDTANALGEKNIKTLSEKIQRIEQKHNVRIGIQFLKTINNQNIDTTANYLLKKYYGDSQNGGIILLVVMDNRKWNIALDAKMNQRILNYSDVSDLHDGFMDKLHNNNFVGAADIYLQNVDELLNYYEQHGEPFDRSEQFNPTALGISILIAILLGFGVRSWLIGSMSNVRHAHEATDYLKRDSINLTEMRDTYLFTNISRRPKSSGGSSGGRSSGGGSSGGGSF